MDLERQLSRLRSYALVTYPFACVPFLFLFFTEHGMDAAAYGEILTAYYATMFLAEVPTGVLGDRLGARRMLVAGPVLLALGFVTFLCLGLRHSGIGPQSPCGDCNEEASRLIFTLLGELGEMSLYWF